MEGDKGLEKLFEEVVDKNFPNLRRKIDICIQDKSENRKRHPNSMHIICGDLIFSTISLLPAIFVSQRSAKYVNNASMGKVFLVCTPQISMYVYMCLLIY